MFIFFILFRIFTHWVVLGYWIFSHACCLLIISVVTITIMVGVDLLVLGIFVIMAAIIHQSKHTLIDIISMCMMIRYAAISLIPQPTPTFTPTPTYLLSLSYFPPYIINGCLIHHHLHPTTTSPILLPIINITLIKFGTDIMLETNFIYMCLYLLYLHYPNTLSHHTLHPLFFIVYAG